MVLAYGLGINQSQNLAWNLGQRQPIDGGGGFVPSQLANLSLWLDASDTNTITQVAGAVSQWNDKSVSGNNLTQVTGANQPMFTAASVNGLGSIAYADPRFMTFNTPLSFAGEFTIYAVTTWDGDLTSGEGYFLGNNAAGSTNRIGFLGSQQGRIRVLNGGSAATLAGWTTAAQRLFVNRRDSANKIDSAFNAAAFTRLFSDVAQAGTSAYQRLGRTDSGNNWIGKMCEIVVYSRALSASEDTTVRAYLINKWGAV